MTPKWLTITVRSVDRTLIIVASVGLVAMMLHISIDILSSLLLNAPVAVTSAIVTEYYMIAVAFLPILTAELRGAHIGVNLLTQRLPPAVERALETVVLAIMAGVYLLLTAQTWGQAMSKFAISAYMVEQTTKIYVWPSHFVLPIALGAMALLLLAKVALRMTGRPEPTVLPYDAPAGRSETDHV